MKLIIVVIIVIILVYIFKTKNKFYIANSKIHGNGLFTSIKIKKGDVLFLTVEDHKVTRLGSFVNHSYSPNSVMVKGVNDSEWNLVSLTDINENEEITGNYVDTPDFIKKPEKEWI